MKCKKLLSVALSAVMLSSQACLAVNAEGTAPDKAYNYVALGDSIAAGFGLSSDGTTESMIADPAFIITDDLIANPIQDAYAQVFGTYLAELGAERGYTTTATNLSTTGFRAEDVAQAILSEDFHSDMADAVVGGFLGQRGIEAMSKYHDYFMQYLPEAELVSIQLGGNDIVLEMLMPMLSSQNPILKATGCSLIMTVAGFDSETAIQTGKTIIEQNKDNIDYQTIAEAAAYLKGLLNDTDSYVEKSAENVTKVVDAVKAVNSDTDIALVGMFNPYGNSLVYDGQIYNMSTVIKNIFTRAAEEVCGQKLDIDDEIELVTDEETEEKTESCCSHIAELKQRMAKIKQQKKEKMAQLLSIISDEIAYPMQYLLAGKNVAPSIISLNEKLQNIADEKGAVFVDVYDISNELNLDPHPDANGHYEIAEFMKNTLSDKVIERMVVPEAESVALNKTAVNIGIGQNYTLTATVAPTDAIQKVTWSSNNEEIASVDANGVVTGKKLGTATITATTDNGLTAVCKINVKHAPESITLNRDTLSINALSTYTFTKTLTAKNSASSFKWTSSNPDVVKVYSTGKIVALQPGTATITVTTYNGKTASCEVTVA